MVITAGIEPNAAKRIRQRQGDKIRKIRKMRDLSIEEFAKLLDVTPGAVSQWETGRYSPRQALQVKIAQILDLPWSFIFGLDGEAA